MNTSQYDSDTRKMMKRGQQTPAYRDLQKRTAAERALLETTLRSRNEVIDRLSKALVDAGVDAKDVAKLAA
jgi:hypothetical protein